MPHEPTREQIEQEMIEAREQLSRRRSIVFVDENGKTTPSYIELEKPDLDDYTGFAR
jgi:hypothetical protein